MKLRKLLRQRKGQVVLYIFFIISAIIIITIAAVFAPMGVLFNTKMIQAGEDILGEAQDEIDLIQDTRVQAAVNSTVDAAFDAATTNINVNANIFQYGWLVMIILVGLIVFMQSRTIVEYNRRGGFV